jgi:uncharacterized protein
MQHNQQGSTPLTALILALGIAVAGISISHAIKYFKNFDRYVEVKGLSERIVRSNQASWQVGFTASGDDLKNIYASINDQQKTITDFLVKNGFAAKDITKQPVSIYENTNVIPLDSSGKRAPKYSANAGINVSSNNVDSIMKTVQLTNQLVEAGVILNNNNVTYLYTNLNAVKAPMLDEALTNARVSASQFAAKSDSNIGKIRNANQGLFTITSPDPNIGDANSIDKRVRIVTTVQFFLK